jgi:hypothetical protein
LAIGEEGLRLRRELGDLVGTADSLINLGNAVFPQCNFKRAVALFEQALTLLHQVGDIHGIAVAVAQLGMVASKQGEYGRAAALFLAAHLGGAAEHLREVLGVPLRSHLQVQHDRTVQALHKVIGRDRFSVTWHSGKALPPAQAMALALDTRLGFPPSKE